MIIFNRFSTVVLASLVIFSAGCKKKKTTDAVEPTTVSYTIPTTYNGFTNVDHTESTTIIGMTTELSAEIAKGTGSSSATVPTPLNKTHLLNLLKNLNNEFTTSASYNSSGYQIENNCNFVSHAPLESFIDSLVAVSNSSHVATSGVAGLGRSLDATPKRYLLTANGENYSQILNKTLMYVLVYNQIATRLIKSANLDNTTLITSPDGTKQYTAMEHNWDVAFGYWSVPDSFPIVKTPVKLWGSYSNQIDAGLGCNSTVMNAFLKGRAAISNKDMTTMQQQADIIVSLFDVMSAGALVQDLNEVQVAYNAGDAVKVASLLSECKGFVTCMQFNTFYSKRIITDEQLTTLIGYFPPNLWNMQQADFDKIRAYICNVYGFTAAQSASL